MRKPNKEMFLQVMEKLEKQFAVDEKCNKAFSVILPSTHCSFYDNTNLVNAFFELLEFVMEDDKTPNWDSLIAYFVYDLKFGKEYKEGCVLDKNNKPIDISTAEKLWEYLIKN